jgi:lipid II:glycine glycyltransferase (peptidoglycan interpeptide bridge formation enzyme)
MHESVRSNGEPLFVNAIDERGECVGVALGTLVSPRHWPFSRFCKKAILSALPATREKDEHRQRVIVAAIEQAFKGKGIFSIQFCSYDSPASASVLSSLSYNLNDRCEFYIDLSVPKEAIWNNLRSSRRNDIRKAIKLGVETRMANTVADLQVLFRLQAQSMQRRGMDFHADIEQAAMTKALLLDTGRAVLLISYYDGVPINAALFGCFEGRAYYLQSGSSRVGYKMAGPVHLLWNMIELSKAAGGVTLNLGGVSSPSRGAASRNGLYSFKRDFGASIVSQPAGTKTISRFGAGMNSVLESLKRKVGH